MRSAGAMSLVAFNAGHACMMMCLSALFMSGRLILAQPTAGIILYEHFDFKGKSLHLLGSKSRLGPLGFNDKVSSIKVLSNKWTLYQHANFLGSKKDYSPGEYARISPNDQASSVEVFNTNGGGFVLSPGSPCIHDGECNGYCELGLCRQGLEGDFCGQNGDCQGSLTCTGFPQGKCTRKKSEGAKCGSDDDCIGYCEILKCWDGSKGDRCGRTSDCQGNLKCKRRIKCHKPCRFCPQICLPADAFRTCR